jgi:hypothetical protein
VIDAGFDREDHGSISATAIGMELKAENHLILEIELT